MTIDCPNTFIEATKTEAANQELIGIDQLLSSMPTNDSEFIRSEIFYSRLYALFCPLALHIQRYVNEELGHDCAFRFELVDGQYFPDPLKSWAYGFITITCKGKHSVLVVCSVIGHDDPLCTFEGAPEKPYFADMRLEECLDQLLPVLREEAKAWVVGEVVQRDEQF